MKKICFLLALSCFTFVAHAQNNCRPGTTRDTVIHIPVTAFQTGEVARTGVIMNDLDAARIIDAVMGNGSAEAVKSNSERAIIIVQHQLDPKKLVRVDSTTKSEWCERYESLQKDTLIINKRLRALTKTADSNVMSSDSLTYLEYLTARLDTVISEMKSIESQYKQSDGGFGELDPIVSYIYHFDKSGKHADYLLGVTQVEVITIGGKTDLASSTISTKRTATRNETDFAAAAKLATSLFSTDPALVFNIEESKNKIIADRSSCPLNSKLNKATIAVTLMHLDPSKLYAPGDIIITPLGKSALTFNLHARQWVGVQAGIAGTSFYLRSYSIVNDSLTVTSPLEKTKWDVLPMFFIQIYPGRDIDRLAPVNFKYRNSFGTFLRNRIGFYGGFQISKRPLHSVACGITFALGPNVNLHCGMQWTRTLDIVDRYPLGPLQEKDRLEEFAPTSYLQRGLSFGISVNPGAYKDWFSN